MNYVPDVTYHDILFEIKGGCDKNDRAKILKVNSKFPIVSTDGQEFHRYIMIVQMNKAYGTYCSWKMWRYDEYDATRTGNMISDRPLILWCRKNNIECVPIYMSKGRNDFTYLEELMEVLSKKYGTAH